MNNLKKLFSKTSETFRKLIKKFPVTLIIILLTTIFMAVDIKQNTEFFEEIVMFFTVTAVGTFATEACLHKKKTLKIISYIASAVIALGFTVLVKGSFSPQVEESATRILIGYSIILFLISIYKIIKENNISFEEYILKVFANMFNSGVTYLVLNLGLTLITAIFVELILSGSWGHILGRIQILLLGLFLAPATLNSMWDVKEKEVNTFIKGLVKFVLLPLVTISMAIIYVYIIKILVLRKMPSNIIFRILAGIFIVAFPVWNMAKNFKKDNKIIDKTTNILPYAYMPFILLEIYSIYTRIAEFGITPVRYFGLVFIVIQVIALILTVIKKGEKLPQTFIYMAVLVVIAFILPLNYNKASYLSQSNILKKEFPENAKFEELSEKSKMRVSGAYRYLESNDALKYIPENVKQHYKTITKDTPVYDEGVNATKQIYVSDSNTLIDISNYSKMYKSSGGGANGEITFYRENEEVKANLAKLIKEAIKSEKAEEYISGHRLVKIDDEKDLYIITLYVSYDEEVRYTSVDAYILYK